MADLVTHLAVGLLVKRAAGGSHAACFAAGNVLPDLLARVPAMLSAAARQRAPVPDLLLYGWDPLHMPVGMALSSYLLSLLFPADQRRAAWANLLAGMGLHLALDVLQDHYGVGYALLFPFSARSFELGLIGSEATVPLAPLLAAAAVVVWYPRWRRFFRR